MFCQMQSPGFGEPKESLEPLWKLKSQLHCGDLGLFISSFVLKKKKKIRNIQNIVCIVAKRVMKCAKTIWPFSFRSTLVSRAIRIFLNLTKMFCDRHQVNEKGCSLAALEVISHLSSLAKKKNVIGLETSQHLMKIF